MLENLTLHEDTRSGNCYKIRLTAALLGLPLERQGYDIMNSETRTPEFLANVNANIAEGSALIPAGRFDRADMLRWMFFEQYNHEPNIATLRFWLAFIGEQNLTDTQRVQLPAKRAAGEAALALMDDHLSARPWFAGGDVSLADIALFAYSHVSEAGGFRLRDHRHVCAWLDRVAGLPGYVPMDCPQ